VRVSLIELFSTAFVVAFSGAMMPGPVLTATIHQVTSHGARAGFLITAGHAVPELAVVIGMSYGLGRVIEAAAFKGAVGLAGGLVLLLMAWGMARYRPAAIAAEDGEGRRASWLGPVTAGMVTTVSNPYWIGWWATVGTMYISSARDHAAAGWAAFFSGHILADLAWYGAIGIVLARGRRIAGGAAFTWLVRLCALFMVYIGVRFFVSGLQVLRAVG